MPELRHLYFLKYSFSTFLTDSLGRGGHMRETGAICQIGGFSPETVHFGGLSKGHLQACGATKIVNVLFSFFDLLGQSKSLRDTGQIAPKCFVWLYLKTRLVRHDNCQKSANKAVLNGTCFAPTAIWVKPRFADISAHSQKSI